MAGLSRANRSDGSRLVPAFQTVVNRAIAAWIGAAVISRRLLLGVLLGMAPVSAGGVAVASSVASPRSARATLAISDALPVPGERVLFHGRATARPGSRVVLERREAGGWVRMATGRLDAHSTFAFALRFSDLGDFLVRAALPPATGYPGAYSPALRFDVSELHKIKHVVVIMQENR